MLFKRRLLIPLVLFFAQPLSGQTPYNLGVPVNSQLTSEYSPSISGNGRTLIFTATSGEDNKPELLISYAKAGIWSRPEAVPNMTSATGKIALPKDPILSYDGNSIYFSASKYGGVGGSDVWIMEKVGNTWTLPKNLAKPINSEGHEGDPSISPNGKLLYLVRYNDKKSPTGQPCGKIFVSEKTGNLWKEPKELPASINMGCECNPRILADNQTLLFASVRTGGKGGFDQYRTQLKEDGTWTTPVALAFVNTAKDDQYVSIPAQGNFIYYTGPSKIGTDIFKMIVPEELRPKNVLAIEGIIKDKQTQLPIAGKVLAYDIKKNTIANLIQTDATGKFMLYLTAGAQYDFSISANNAKNYSYHSEYIDLDTMTKYTEWRRDAALSTLQKDLSINTANIAFENNTDKILPRSTFELGRIQKILQDNPTATLEIGVTAGKIIQDTVPSEMLTEILIDSIEVADPSDTTGLAKIKIAKTTYHNDNTQKQADAIVNALVKKGVPSTKLVAKGYGDKNPIVPSPISSNPALVRRIEIKVLKP